MISINIKNGQPKALSIDTKKINKSTMNVASKKGQSYLEDEARKITGATSLLVNSLTSDHTDTRAEIYSMAMYGKIALEDGRKPGKMPPSEDLKKWATLKLGDPKAAYGVAISIAQNGTKKYQDKKPKQITRAKKKLVKEIGQIYIQQLKKTIT